MRITQNCGLPSFSLILRGLLLHLTPDVVPVVTVLLCVELIGLATLGDRNGNKYVVYCYVEQLGNRCVIYLFHILYNYFSCYYLYPSVLTDTSPTEEESA